MVLNLYSHYCFAKLYFIRTRKKELSYSGTNLGWHLNSDYNIPNFKSRFD